VNGKRQRGMTMIELLVAMAIGVITMLAISQLLVASENHKRTTTSTNDVDQTAVYTFNEIDRALRAAGSGIAQSAYGTATGVLGCRLNMASAGTTYMPRPGAYPPPFSTRFLGGATPAALQVAPVLIGAGQSDNSTSDVLVVMGGSGADGGVSRSLFGVGSLVSNVASLILASTVGFNNYDLILVSQNGMSDCLLEEVSGPPAAGILTLNPAVPYYTQAQGLLTTLIQSTTTAITPLGNVQPTDSPSDLQFQMFGVSTNNTLYSYDLLQNQNLVHLAGTGGDVAQAIADGVIQMNAIYGVATANNPSVFDHWVSPSAAAGYDINTVMNSPTKQKLIIAVRVAIVVRGEYYDKSVVSPSSLTIFSGLLDGNGNSLQKTVSLTTTQDQQHYRYRVVEFTVPLREMIVLAGGP
jgi:type IV pilus assembly protein PilW